MNCIKSDKSTVLIVLGLQPGEFVLESVRQAIADNDIRNGVVVSGVGTLKKCVMHYVENTGFPPSDKFFTIEKPLELVSLAGTIADGEPHLHAVVSCREKDVWAGHLEDKSEVLYLAEIVIIKCNSASMKRMTDQKRKVKLLAAIK